MTEDKGESNTPVLPAPRVGRLDRACDIRTEAARLYRAARKGDLPVSDAAKLAYLLSLLAKLIELTEIERDVEELELKNEKA